MVVEEEGVWEGRRGGARQRERETEMETSSCLWRYLFYTPILPIIASGYPVSAPLVHATQMPRAEGTWSPSQGIPSVSGSE